MYMYVRTSYTQNFGSKMEGELESQRLNESGQTDGVSRFLNSYNLGHLKDTFIQNGIDETALQLLKEQDVRDLIPKIGDRVKFLDGWKKEFHRQKVFPLLHEVDEVSDLSSIIETDDASTGGDSDITDILMSPSSSSTTPDLSFDSSSSTPPDQPPTLKRQKRVHFDVKSILLQSSRGRKAMESISSKKFCSKQDRHIVVEICTSYLTEHYGDKPSSFIKGALAAAVVELFPFLKDPESPLGYEAWYAKGAAGRPATGYIEDHLRYIRKKKISLEKLSTVPASLSKKKKTTNKAAIPEAVLETEEDIAMMTEWLKCNLEPKEKVKEFMKRTAHFRKKQIKDTSTSLQTILEDYPHLLDTGMIEQDFAYLYPGKEDCPYQKWGNYYTGIIEYGTQVPQWREILGLENMRLEDLSVDEKKNLAFFVLPIMFRGKLGNKSKGLCSFRQAVSSFVDVQPEVIDIVQYSKHVDATEKPQPFLVCKGNLPSPTQTFVILERRAILQESLLKAVDYCFKATYVLHIDYQPACSLVWKFFQNVIYELPDEYVPNCIRDVRAYLNQKK